MRKNGDVSMATFIRRVSTRRDGDSVAATTRLAAPARRASTIGDWPAPQTFEMDAKGFPGLAQRPHPWKQRGLAACFGCTLDSPPTDRGRRCRPTPLMAYVWPTLALTDVLAGAVGGLVGAPKTPRFQAVSSAAMPVLARGALCPLPLADAA